MGKSLSDLILTRGGHVFICDVSEEDVNRVQENLKSKHQDKRIEGCVLDVRSQVQWQNAWKVNFRDLGI